MIEVTILGRGGQGAVTAAKLIAISAFCDGYMSQAFPKFGVERRGAPVEAYCRISKSKKLINLRSHIYDPDILIVFDNSLIGIDKLKKIISNKDKRIIINAGEQFKEDISKIIKNKKNVLVFDASSISLEIMKRNIVNVAMVALFSLFTNIISIKSIYKAINQVFDQKLADINKKVVDVVVEKWEERRKRK